MIETSKDEFQKCYSPTKRTNKDGEGGKTNNKIVVGIVIGLVVGLVLGIFVSVIFNLPIMIHTGAGTNNQVQVSGTVSITQTGTIEFVNLNYTIKTSGPITSSKYSVLLIGGQSYTVIVNQSYEYSLYVPLGVTTFTANF